MTPHAQTIQRLNQAMLARDVPAAHECITPDFEAFLPAHGEQPLTFDELLQEFSRRRDVFADFGENVEILNAVAQADTVMVYYRMTVTCNEPSPEAGFTFSFTSVDIVEFAPDGRIRRLTVVSDRRAATEAFNKAATR